VIFDDDEYMVIDLTLRFVLLSLVSLSGFARISVFQYQTLHAFDYKALLL